MTSVIDRALAGYCAATVVLIVPVATALAPFTEVWWMLAFGGGLVATAVWMNVLAHRRRSLKAAAAVYAALVPLGYVAQYWGVAPNPVPQAGVLAQAVGVAVVCAGLWRGGRVAVGYALVVAALLVDERTGPRGGSIDPLLAVCEAIFSVGAGLSILAVALGMLAAAEAADALDARVRMREVDLAVERAVAARRARLDQVIHDDVMTALTAASRAYGAESVAGLRRLATDTVRTIDDLGPTTGGRELVPFAVLRQLVIQTCARISPRIVVSDEAGGRAVAGRVPVAVAEAGLSAVREALRNALRHSGAGRIEVELRASTTADGSERLLVGVRDDGRGFAVGAVPEERLGVRVSMDEALTRVGLEHRLRSEPGSGTEFAIVWAGEPGRRPEVPAPSATVPELPAEFPVRRLILVTWATTLGLVAIGLALLPRVLAPWSLAGMVLICVLMAVLLHAGSALALPRRWAGLALVLLTGLCVAMVIAVPATGDPSVTAWHRFPVQLVLVVLVLRRRRGTAAAALLIVSATNLAWWLSGDLSFGLGIALDFGAVTFIVMALLVDAMLRRISQRQQHLRAQERAAVDDAVRTSIATLQGALWVSDLKARSRDVLGRLAALTAPPSPALVTEALMLEATLREEIVARNVMNEELAALTDTARRRGVEVRLVDSRATPASGELARAVNAEVRDTLRSRGLSRLVVRWAPDAADEDGHPRGAPATASVVQQSAADVTLTTVDDEGMRDVRHAPGR